MQIINGKKNNSAYYQETLLELVINIGLNLISYKPYKLLHQKKNRYLPN